MMYFIEILKKKQFLNRFLPNIILFKFGYSFSYIKMQTPTIEDFFLLVYSTTNVCNTYINMEAYFQNFFKINYIE